MKVISLLRVAAVPHCSTVRLSLNGAWWPPAVYASLGDSDGATCPPHSFHGFFVSIVEERKRKIAGGKSSLF